MKSKALSTLALLAGIAYSSQEQALPYTPSNPAKEPAYQSIEAKVMTPTDLEREYDRKNFNGINSNVIFEREEGLLKVIHLFRYKEDNYSDLTVAIERTYNPLIKNPQAPLKKTICVSYRRNNFCVNDDSSASEEEREAIEIIKNLFRETNTKLYDIAFEDIKLKDADKAPSYDLIHRNYREQLKQNVSDEDIERTTRPDKKQQKQR